MGQILLNLFRFAADLLLSHRLSLGREKRKEFNEAVQPIRSFFLAEYEAPSPYRKLVTREELDLFLQVMPTSERLGFCIALERFKQSKKAVETRDNYGGVLYTDTSDIKEAALHVLSYTNRK